MKEPIMQVRLGDTIARCAHCGSTEFVHMEPGNDLDEASDLVCATCEAPALHGELILQIATPAYREAGSRLRGTARKHAPKRRNAAR
jgi:hypothetical protein